MDNKISLDLDETIKGKIDAALQKPTGLTKTKLVGVGTNGQESIEIGDNLTLANGKLSAASGGGVNGLESDAEGNLTASKNLGVDGKLTLKSLVSESNPDGDIRNALGGSSSRHGYSIIVNDTFHYEVYTTTDYNLEIGQQTTVKQFYVNNNYAELRKAGYYPASGFFYKDTTGDKILVSFFQISRGGSFYIEGYNLAKNPNEYDSVNYNFGYSSATVVQLF